MYLKKRDSIVQEHQQVLKAAALLSESRRCLLQYLHVSFALPRSLHDFLDSLQEHEDASLRWERLGCKVHGKIKTDLFSQLPLLLLLLREELSVLPLTLCISWSLDFGCLLAAKIRNKSALITR